MSPFRALSTAAVLLALVACSAKKEDAVPAVVTPPGVTWTVDGADITATSIQHLTTGSLFKFTALNTANTTRTTGVELTFDKAVGTRYIVAGNGGAVTKATYFSGTPIIYYGTSGSVTVTSLTADNIIGTFYFTGEDLSAPGSRTITNGKFNIAL